MKAKKILVLSLVVVSLFSLSSCGKNSEDDTYADNGSSYSDFENRPMQRNFNQNPADIYGEVKSVSGDKISIALLEQPERRQMTDEEREKMRQRRDNNQDGQDNKSGDKDKPSQKQAPKGDGNNKPSSDREGPKGDGNPNDRGPGRGGFTAEKKYTGETKEITVSSDTPITTFGMGGFDRNNFDRNGNDSGERKAPEQQTLKVSEVKEGSIIQVWYKDNTADNKEIDRITIMQMPK